MFFVWLMRIHCCRGFGIQSPSDYAFVRYVVNEHYPYYSYSDLKALMPHVDWKTRKLCCLYFRIANFLQPDVIFGSFCAQAYYGYLHAGCNKALIIGRMEMQTMSVDHIVKGLFVISVSDADFTSLLAKVIGVAGESSIMVVEDIYADKEAKARWREIKADERVGVTFDLYYAGIVFFDLKRYKQSYKINF